MRKHVGSNPIQTTTRAAHLLQRLYSIFVYCYSKTHNWYAEAYFFRVVTLCCILEINVHSGKMYNKCVALIFF